jgi:DNA topoisomerase-1
MAQTTCVVIVESYTKCAKIENFLGSAYKCVACFGHFRELCTLKAIKNLSALQFTELQNKKALISKLRLAVTNAKEVILATDADREGEAIAWHLCDVLKLPLLTTKRMRFSEITATAVQQALRNATVVNMQIVYAQFARQVLDLLMGYKISPVLWKNVTDAEGLSAGRCQTPALRLIYDQHCAKLTEVSTYAYSLTGYFTGLNIPFQMDKSLTDADDVKNFLQISQKWPHVYHREETFGEITINAPRPFNTSSLIQCASKELQMSPSEIMRSCQTLYETGNITYLRTDSTHYNADFIKEAVKFLRKEYACIGYDTHISMVITPEHFAHEAIRPVCISQNDPIGIDLNANKALGKLYKLIRRNTLQSLLGPCKEKTQNHFLSAPLGHQYKHVTKQVTQKGWRIVADGDIKKDEHIKKDEQEPTRMYLNYLKQDSVQPYNRVTAKVYQTDAQVCSHYTEAALVQKLDLLGIGRPSTYTSILEKLFAKNYITKEKNLPGKTIMCKEFELLPEKISLITAERVFGAETNKIVITPTGISVIECLWQGGFAPLFQYEYTQQMEKSLDAIALTSEINNEVMWQKLCKHVRAEIEAILGKQLLPETEKKNITLGKYENITVQIKHGKFGFYLQYGDLKLAIDDESMPLLEAIALIQAHQTGTDPKLVRVLTEDASIRIGPHGDYLFYKNKKMSAMKKKPKFLALTNIPADYKTCDVQCLKEWFFLTYKIKL